MADRTYIAIDLKSFYASAECADRGLDPLTTNLVVADSSRTEKTICLAVSPSLKALGIPGRPRLFEVVEKVREVNAARLSAYQRQARDRSAKFTASSFDAPTLAGDASLELAYIVAPPRMARYVEVSTQIYAIYLKYIAPEDIIVYSIDEVFIDATSYLPFYGMTAHELVKTILRDVLDATGITATAGIGTNLYLAKIAMDIEAKHAAPDKDGVRIAQLDEASYRRQLWAHQPITDFWRVGRGYAKKLARYHMHTMGDVALCSVGRHPVTGEPDSYYNEDLLYRLFGINAELLIDHAWGWEPCTVDIIKTYRPQTHSISSGQVLKEPYDFAHARLIVKEMTDQMALDLVEKGLVTNQLVLTVGYDRESLTRPDIHYTGPVTTDHYGRRVPKHAHGTANLGAYTSGTRQMMPKILELYDRIVGKDLLVRRITLVAAHTIPETEIPSAGQVSADGTGSLSGSFEQLDLFTDYEALEKKRAEEAKAHDKEHRLQLATLEIKKRYGKNAMLKGMNLEEGGTAIERNGQIGGHKK